MMPFWFGFIPPRTGPDPSHTKPIPEIFFFGQKRVRMQQYPDSIRTHKVPGTGMAGFLPYRYFLDYMAFYYPSYEFINQTLKSVLHPDISLLMGKFCKLNVRYILACCLVHCLSLALSRLHIMGFSKTLTRFLLCLDIDGWMFQY